jgi:hypothetical protein
MDKDQFIFRLDGLSMEDFDKHDEVFSGAQLGRAGALFSGDLYLVVDGQIAVAIKPGLSDSLKRFYTEVWDRFQSGGQTIEKLYDVWKLQSLDELSGISCEPVSRATRQHFIVTGSLPANPIPPPPPTNPNVTPGGARPPGTPSIHGHLPFQTVGTGLDIYYRFEAWPTSRRVNQRAKTILNGTFASPSSELQFLPTGFAAVARNALPSFFPAVFRYELAPNVGTTVLCGAVVPMFGMSGGGVEAILNRLPHTKNRGPIANPAIINPL